LFDALSPIGKHHFLCVWNIGDFALDAAAKAAENGYHIGPRSAAL